MMIEQNTNYAYKLKYMDNPTFDKVRDLSTKFYRELPQALQDELFEALNRGIDILDSEPQMTAYLFAFGKMHQAKLDYAFGKLPKEFLEQLEINIIDYGCGQALGTMCYADFLRENGYVQKVKTITLIEPSEICLKRAALHASVFFPNAEIKTVNKTFDELDENDIYCDEDSTTLHILSNVLDILDFDLEEFAGLINGQVKGYNNFVSVGPYFNFSDKDNRMIQFRMLIGGKAEYRKILDKYELDSGKEWTAQILCFSVGMMEEENLSTIVTEDDLFNAVEDEYGVLYSSDGEKCLMASVDGDWLYSLQSYSIKQGTKVICDHAFDFDANVYEIIPKIERIEIPNSVISIGNFAFSHLSFIEINIPSSVIHIGDNPFKDSSEVKVISDSSRFVVEDYQLIDKKEAKLIAFLGIQNNTESGNVVTISNSITAIGNLAFEVDIIRFHGFQVFSESPLFEVINNMLISRNENKIIKYFGKEKVVKLPENIVGIGNSAFKFSNIEQLILPPTIQFIEDYAFEYCMELRQIIVPNCIIGNYAFSCCFKLQQVLFYESDNNRGLSLGDFVFKSSSLRQVVLSSNIENIGSNPFGSNQLNICSQSPRFIIVNNMLIDSEEHRLISYFGYDNKITVPDGIIKVGEKSLVSPVNLDDWKQCKEGFVVTIPKSVTIINAQSFDLNFAYWMHYKLKLVVPKGSRERFLLELIHGNNNMKWEFEEKRLEIVEIE